MHTLPSVLDTTYSQTAKMCAVQASICSVIKLDFNASCIAIGLSLCHVNDNYDLHTGGGSQMQCIWHVQSRTVLHLCQAEIRLFGYN